MTYFIQGKLTFRLNLYSTLPKSIQFRPANHVATCDHSLFTCKSLISQGGVKVSSQPNVD